MAPTNLIIFGFTGDLVKRKLLPSLYHLELDGLLGEQVNIVGTVRREISLDELKSEVREFLVSDDGECLDEHLDKVFDRITIANVDILKSDEYPKLKTTLEDLDKNTCRNRVFYFAVPPTLFEEVIENLVENDLHTCDKNEVTRLLIEKPFGSNVESAQKLLTTINKTFGEEHIYRIDHYLAKETVQNILHFRFHNPMFTNLFNANEVACIQVSALESIDIQGRSGFYEETGALRDMIQSHLLQVLALATMDEPKKLDAQHIREKRQELLTAIKSIGDVETNTIRGQYKGYKDEVENHNSRVETFAALKLAIDNDRWRGVPIFLRAGKAVDQKLTEITLTFKDHNGQPSADNILTLRIQPNEGIAMQLKTKKPGLGDESIPVSLDYCFQEDPDQTIHDAYEKIILDAINGDQTLFPTDVEIMNNWHLIEPILDHWSQTDQGLEIYEKGSAGPNGVADLTQLDKLKWVTLPNVCVPRFKQ